MNLRIEETVSNQEKFAFYNSATFKNDFVYGTRGGWYKYHNNPVFGDGFGVCFDVSVLYMEGCYKMWFSWRDKKSIAYTTSHDCIHWEKPVVVISPIKSSNWESDEINRPSVIKHENVYYMWYSGQVKPYREDGYSSIGIAFSTDGIHWDRRDEPVLVPEYDWEKKAIMCPHVLYDENEKIFKMWFSAGSNHEPDAIGYAFSFDGINWIKHDNSPIFEPNTENLFEQYKVLGGQVLKLKDYYYMFYIAHMHEERAVVCLARSRDGITKWQRYPDNPIISPEQEGWDNMAIYKPFAVFDGNRWILFYNGATYDEQIWADEKIGIAYLDRVNLWDS